MLSHLGLLVSEPLLADITEAHFIHLVVKANMSVDTVVLQQEKSVKR